MAYRPDPPAEPEPPSMREALERAPSREVLLRPRTVLAVMGTVLAVIVTVRVLMSAWQVITWVVIAAFFAIALMPAVDALERRGLPNAVAVVSVALATLAAIGLLAWAFVPPLVAQTTDLVEAVPDALDDVTAGRGPLGFLQSEYGLVDRAREALADQSGDGVLGLTSPALEFIRGVLTAVVAAVTIFFLTVFMLREGRAWVAAGLALVPERSRPRWERILAGVTRTIRGYVTGNLLISVIAGLVAYATLALTGVPYAVPLALLVAVLDLVPLVGATAGTIAVTAVAVGQGLLPGLIVLAVLVVYQQVENHLLQPLVYGRTVELSPLLILVAVLIGGAIAGIIGALIAIPIAGSLQVVVVELLRGGGPGGGPTGPAAGAPDESERGSAVVAGR